MVDGIVEANDLQTQLCNAKVMAMVGLNVQ